MYRVTRAFTQQATKVAKEIIDDLSKSEGRRHSPVAAGGVAGGEKYLADGIFFKLARDWQGLYGSDEAAMKAATLEASNLREYLRLEEPKLHVPLAVLLDYKGAPTHTSARPANALPPHHPSTPVCMLRLSPCGHLAAAHRRRLAALWLCRPSSHSAGL